MQPGWVYRPVTNDFHWRELQRTPEVRLVVERVHHKAWEVFRHHHYLDTSLNTSALCFVAFWKEQPVAFIAALSFPHHTKPGWRLHRLVCLPDYQGVGIGVALSDFVSSVLAATGKPVTRAASHPSVVAHCARSSKWQMFRAPSINRKHGGKLAHDGTHSAERLTASFRYCGAAADKQTVDALSIA
jgi:GNAT superfamily N-acetyltransferase